MATKNGSLLAPRLDTELVQPGANGDGEHSISLAVAVGSGLNDVFHFTPFEHFDWFI
jgi:hypothetical protein